MLPVDHPKAVKEIIPRLADHYGVKSSWQAETIRQALDARRSGPLFPSPGGWRPRRDFAAVQAASEQRAAALRAAAPDDVLHELKDWLAGKAVPGLVSDSRDFGRQFHPAEALRRAASLMNAIEAARLALGDLPQQKQPRFDPGVWGAWVYAFPDVDLYNLPRPARTKKEKP